MSVLVLVIPTASVFVVSTPQGKQGKKEIARGQLQVLTQELGDGNTTATATSKVLILQIEEAFDLTLGREAQSSIDDPRSFTFTLPTGVCFEFTFGLGTSDQLFLAFVTLLEEYSTFTKPSKIANTVVKGSLIAASLITKGSILAKSRIEQGADVSVCYLKSNDVDAKISDSTRRNLDRAKNVTGATAALSGRVAGGALSVTKSLGSSLANRLVSKNSKDGNSSLNPTVKAIGKASLFGLGQVMGAVDEASKTIVDSSADAGVKVTTHKYGEEAGQAARTTTDAVKNVLETSANLAAVRPTGILKGTAKEAGKEYIRN